MDLLLLEVLVFKAHVVVVKCALRSIDVEDESGEHTELIEEDSPVAIESPISDHVLNGEYSATPALILHEDEELVENKNEQLESSRASQT